jgi:hypothetical protein
MRKFTIKPINGRDAVYVNGSPNLNQIPKEVCDYLLSSLELEISDYYKNLKENKSDKPPP